MIAPSGFTILQKKKLDVKYIYIYIIGLYIYIYKCFKKKTFLLKKKKSNAF